MNISLFYLLAILPCMVGGFFWLKSKNICWQEWLINSIICFVMAGIFNIIAVCNNIDDIEIWSGKITHAKQFSEWREYYEEAIYRTEYYTDTETYYTTDSKGKRHSHTRTVRKSRRVFDHWEPRTRIHHAEWKAYSNINTEYNISLDKYKYFVNKFGKDISVKGKRHTGEHNSRMIGGDPNDYQTTDINKWVEPITKRMTFENKIRYGQSAFSFVKVPENIKLFDYPDCPDPFNSNRLLGTASQTIDRLVFDQMNANLGPIKRVNVIMVGFGDKSTMYAKWLEASWYGGKKNDIVITWGGDNKKPDWVVAFGWTDSKIVLRDLETIVLENGATTDTLDLISKEITQNYKLKHFEKDFSYISIPVRSIHFITYIIVMVLSQIGLWIYYHKNEFGKETKTQGFKKYYNWR